MSGEYKVGDKVSLENTIENVVMCRGEITEVIKRGDTELCTMDGLHYFRNGYGHKDRFRIVKKEDTDSDNAFYTPFQHVRGVTYGSIASNDDADIYLRLDDENLSKLQREITDKWCDIYPGSKIAIDIGKNTLKVDSEDEDAKKDIDALIIDKVNIFGKRFEFDGICLRSKADNEVTVYEDYLKVNDYLQQLIACNYRKYPEEELLYWNNHGRRSFQWELWSMCNNLCTYCYLGKENRHTDKVRQMTSLTDCHKAIDELDTRIYNNVAIIGGDFWQGQLEDPEVYESFMSLMRKIAKLYADKKIGSVWLTCTMTIGDQKDLYDMIEIFKSYGCFPNEEYTSSGLWLCTSWDIKGRFHTPDRLKNWDYHMKHIHEVYPWVKFNCTIILMEDFLKAYLNDEWSPKRFMEEYHTCLFYKQIGLGMTTDEEVLSAFEREYKPNNDLEMLRMSKQYLNKIYGFEFAPHRATMLAFLRKYAMEDPDTYDRLFNIKYRADELHRNYNDHEHDSKTLRNKNSANESDSANENKLNTCGHMLNYAPYCDSDKCCICDKFSIWESIYGER